MNSVIISGADGFIGRHTVSYLLEQGMNVLALGRKEIPKYLKPHKKMNYMQCDISDREFMLKNIEYNKYDTFIHFAWKGTSGEERLDYNLQMSNAWNTVECMKTAKELKCNRFVCAGSIMEYEAELAIHMQEELKREYIYGMSKHIAHCVCNMIAKKIGIELIWPIVTNTYGIGEESERFISTTLRKIINNQSLQFTAGTQNYDFIYVTDVAKAFYFIAQNGRPFCRYLIGSSNARPLKEFILEIQNVLDPSKKFQFGCIPFEGINLPLSVYDTRTVEACGFKPHISFSEGIAITMEWLKSKVGCIR